MNTYLIIVTIAIPVSICATLLVLWMIKAERGWFYCPTCEESPWHHPDGRKSARLEDDNPGVKVLRQCEACELWEQTKDYTTLNNLTTTGLTAASSVLTSKPPAGLNAGFDDRTIS